VRYPEELQIIKANGIEIVKIDNQGVVSLWHE
jgi:hypothetical protein